MDTRGFTVSLKGGSITSSPLQAPRAAAVAKTASPTAAQASDTITYTIVVTASQTTAHNVSLADILPGGVTYVPGSLAHTAGVTPTTLATAAGGNSFTATYMSLTPGQTSTLTFRARVDGDVTSVSDVLGRVVPKLTGAGAVVVGASAQPNVGLLGTKLGAYGDCVDLLCIPGGGSNAPATAASLAGGDHFLKMKGKEVFKYAVRGMEEAARDILEQHAIPAHQIALVIPHQANLRIIEAIAQYLELPLERFFVNLDRYGNTSAASIPIALDEARRSGRIKSGDLTLLVAFGAGLTYGSALLRW
jgi:3-oxoacyl-[acyl-carrier-protein] synthase-3